MVHDPDTVQPKNSLIFRLNLLPSVALLPYRPWSTAGILIFASCFHNNSNRESDKISYNFDIRPILSDKCFKCHGPDANHREAHLRLDIADSAYAPLHNTKGAFAIVPGHPDRSELLKRVSSSDLSYQMPPADTHLGALTPQEVSLFEKWIRQGAQYERHWAFTPPVKSPAPAKSRIPNGRTTRSTASSSQNSNRRTCSQTKKPIKNVF